MKAKGKTPKALLDKPSIPWYYEVFIRHYHTLSNSRTYRSDMRMGEGGRMYYVSTPNPIDIPSILKYNKCIVKMDNHMEFISIIQTLDQVYMEYLNKKRS